MQRAGLQPLPLLRPQMLFCNCQERPQATDVMMEVGVMALRPACRGRTSREGSCRTSFHAKGGVSSWHSCHGPEQGKVVIERASTPDTG